MCENKFYVCEHCGNIVGMVHDAGVPMMCCGQKMKKLEPGVVEASHEKHIPVVTVQENTVEVNVGSVDHPMVEGHWIDWVQLVTSKSSYRKNLKPGENPKVTFRLNDEKPLAVYAYCNLHGLWETELQ